MNFETTGNVEMMYKGCRVLLAQLVDGKMRVNRRMMCALDVRSHRRATKRINECCNIVESYGKPMPEIDNDSWT